MTNPRWNALVTPERRAFWENRHVFVTGGFGLLGTTIVELLDLMGAHITLLRRDLAPDSRLYSLPAYKRVNIVQGDLVDYQTLYRAIAEYEADTVFHVGAQPIAPVGNRTPLPTLEINIMGTANVLEACRLNPTVKRVLVASSDKAYGAQPVLPYTEDAPLRGLHPYDCSKSCTDLLAQMYHKTYQLPVCVTRCGNLYGPGDLNWQRIVPETIKHAIHGERPVIRSDGKFVRDYFFVRDAANGYLTIAENMDRPEVVGQAFNLSTGNGMSAISIVNHVLQAMGKSHLEPVILNQAKAEIQEQTLSSEKALRLLGWKPAFTLEEGLHETTTWYEEHFHSRNKERVEILGQSQQTSTTTFVQTPVSVQTPAPASAPMADEALMVQTPNTVAGIRLTPLKILANEQGQIMHMMRTDTPAFKAFGEVYFSGIYSGVIKGWNLHTKNWTNVSVPQGRVKFVLHDTRTQSPTFGQFQEVTLGEHNYQLLTVPPGVAMAWKNIAPEMALIANCSSGLHDPQESRKIALHDIPYQWDKGTA